MALQRTSDDIIAEWLGKVSQAACMFERRWTTRSLRRVDKQLADRLEEQRKLFNEVTITGSSDDVSVQGAATVRGWNACVKAMEAAGAADDAFLLGFDVVSGFRVAIGNQRAAADRVAELHGHSVVWVTPDEIAAVLASVESFKAIAAIKQFFPGAEMIDREPGEPAKAESGLEVRGVGN